MVRNVATMMAIGEICISDGDGESEKNMVDRQCQLIVVWLVADSAEIPALYQDREDHCRHCDSFCLVPARGVHGSPELQDKYLDL